MQQHRRARSTSGANRRLPTTACASPRVVRDYELHERDQAPADSRAEHT
uniref:Monooxygenase protein n=1 Tax=Ralstonia solanacearum CFBP2957 TaxID=859656 RepID=D8P518_RALSL